MCQINVGLMMVPKEDSAYRKTFFFIYLSLRNIKLFQMLLKLLDRGHTVDCNWLLSIEISKEIFHPLLMPNKIPFDPITSTQCGNGGQIFTSRTLKHSVLAALENIHHKDSTTSIIVIKSMFHRARYQACR